MPRTDCPWCQTRVDVAPADAGGRVACGACGAAFDVPLALRRAGDPPPRPPARRRRDDDFDDRWDGRRRRPRRREADGDGWAAGALVAGVLSLVLFCPWPLGLVAAAAGLVMGRAGLRSPARGLAVTGLVFSAVGLIFALGVAVTMAVVIAAKAG